MSFSNFRVFNYRILLIGTVECQGLGFEANMEGPELRLVNFDYIYYEVNSLRPRMPPYYINSNL